jgi:tetratricopeptide (TPR) repeat protein
MRSDILLLGMICMLTRVGAAGEVESAVGLYNHGEYRQAADAFSKLCREHPEDGGLRVWLGKSYLKLRRWDDAVRELEKAVTADPQNGTYHLWLARAIGKKAEHAFLFSAFGLARRARKEFETASELAPDDLDARFDLLEFYIQAPGIVGGGRSKAEAQAQEIAKRSPRLGYTARADIFREKEEWDKARSELVEATKKFPEDAGSFVDLADFLLARGDLEAAEAGARRAVELDGTSPHARMLLAAAEVELGHDSSQALKVLQELVAGPLTDQDPPFEEVYFWLGKAYLAEGRPEEARKAFDTSLRFDPEYSRSKEARARIKLP